MMGFQTRAANAVQEFRGPEPVRFELERFEQSLNAREQALDSAEGDLEQRRRLRIGEALPQAKSA